MTDARAPRAYDGVLCDLLTALLDSWSLWNACAGSAPFGLAWRRRYLELTYGADGYVPYEELVSQSAREAGLPAAAAELLLADWNRLEPWREAPKVVADLMTCVPVGVVTNCSERLGRAAVLRLGAPVTVAVTAEQAGHYKPHRRPYEMALEQLGLPASRVLYVAGSPYDLPGATAVGLDVVWHNRIGLAPLPGVDARLVAEVRTLDALPALVRGSASS